MKILIYKSYIGEDVPPESYAVAPTEWSDGSRSDMVYASTKFPPILIEVQYQVNQEFMLRLIKSGSNIYKRYKALPIVLVIVTKSFSSAEFQDEFTPSADGLLLETFCKFWAKKCYMLTADAVSNDFQKAKLNPMAALGYFTTLHTMTQVPKQHWRDPTLALVSRIVDDILAKKDNDNILKSDTKYFLDQVKRHLDEIIKDNKNQGTGSKTKTVNHAEEGLISIKQIENDLEDNNSSEGEVNDPKMYTIDDAEFIDSLSKPGKRKKWGEIFDKGKAIGLFKSYKSSATLKSSYYHIQKRNKTSNK